MRNHESRMARAAEWLRSANNLTVFTGAGVSVESGIETFRDAGGFWHRFPPEQFANWRGLASVAAPQPARLAEFLLTGIEPIARARPNPGHLAIAELQKHTRVTVVTQNIDRLHQDAGSNSVCEVHGSLFDIVGHGGRYVRVLTRADLLNIVERIRRAGQKRPSLFRLLLAIRPLYGPGAGFFHRPNIVMFGDAMAEPDWTLARKAAISCDCFLMVGTSAVVMPAAMLPDEARASGAPVIGVGPEEGDADVWLTGPSGQVLPELVRAAFG